MTSTSTRYRMLAMRNILLVIGFVAAVAIAIPAALLAAEPGYLTPLVALWVFVPAPLVVLLLGLRPPRRRAVRRALTAYLAAGAALVVAIVLVGSWHFTNVLRGAFLHDRTEGRFDLEVVGMDAGGITLRPTSLSDTDGPWTQAGVWGLRWEDGYAQVGPIRSLGAAEVVRDLIVRDGIPEIGTAVRLDGFAFLDDPRVAFGTEFEEVEYDSPLGAMPAWFVPGTDDTWVIFVHGRSASRGEALRLIPVVTDLGMPALVINYRNDEDSPPSEDGYLGYGRTEWEDLEGAVRHALDHGARDVVLVGYSMGGGITASFLYRSDLAESVRSVVLDAPMLDFSATIDLRAERRRVPPLLTACAKVMSRFRLGVDWNDINYLKRADELSVPILLFHGDGDISVPIETSDRLAERRPDLVTYVRVPGAGHVRSWNTDPVAYESHVREFLLATVTATQPEASRR